MEPRTIEELESEVIELRHKLAFSDEVLRAIRDDEVDALVVERQGNTHIYTLEGAEHPYRVLVEAMAQGAATLAADGTLIFGNLSLAQILKSPLESLTGVNLVSFITPKDRPLFDAMARQAWASTARGEICFITSDGQDVATYLAVSAVNMGEDKVLCIVVTDLSEQKRDEALLAEERLARSILDSAADGILVCDSQGRIIRSSDAAVHLIGRHPLFEYVDKVFALEDDQGHPFSILEAIAGGRRQGIVVTHRGNGPRPCNFLLSIGPITSTADEHLGAVITLTDITERRNSEEDLARAKKAADAANRAKSNFLTNMSHEIRTPLGVMLGFVELLREPTLKAHEKEDFIETIMRNGRALARLIDDILDLSKVEAGKIIFERITFSLRSLVSEIRTSFEVMAREKYIDLRFEEKGPVPDRITCDPGRIRQILINIIGNAIKFTNVGQVKVTTQVLRTDSAKTPKLVFLVEDTGRGIAKRNQADLFQPFMQGDSSTTRQFGGTGLGLVLAKRLAEGLGGDVTLVDSSPGQGSIFAITLTIGLGDDVAALSQTEGNTILSTKDGSKELREVKILLVDDAPDNQFLIKRLLTQHGASIDVATNGLEAVAHAMADDYDLVLMDMQMPFLDGHGATKELRGKGYTKPIVALTAHAMHEERERCFQSGCDAFLTKPIDHHLLINTVAKFTENNEQRPCSLATLVAREL